MKTVPVLVLGIIVIIIVSLMAIMSEMARQPSSQVATTTVEEGTFACNGDGFVCPDGSVVGRTGPECRFRECPPLNATSTTIQTTLGQKMTGLSVSITPIEVLSDSRCPKDVQCIWAGTVVIRARIESGMGESVMELELGKPVTTEAEEITLAEVMPGKNSQVEIPTSSYRFVFEVRKR